MRTRPGTRNHGHRGTAAASLVSLATLTLFACFEVPVQPPPGGVAPSPSTSGEPPSTSEVSTTATGEPDPPDEPPPAEAELVSGADPENAYLRAVVSMNRDCTGALIKTSDDASAPAHVLTAGRCARHPFELSMYFDVGVDQEPEGTPGFYFYDFHDTAAGSLVQALGVRNAYVTMKGADLALIELDLTIGELQAIGVEPLPLADAAPAAGEPIELAGVPVEHDAGAYQDRYVRRARCKEGTRRADVVEHHWYWRDMHVNDCRGMGPGATGGPALDEQGRVFGVLGTYFKTVEPLDPCYLSYPCEVGGGEPERGVEGASYVVDVTGIAPCFDAGGRLDLTNAGCRLDPGGHASLTEIPSLIARPARGEPSEQSAWGVRLASTSDTHYRYKVGPVESVDCRSAEGYSAPIGIEDDRLANLPVPAKEGLYALCILAGSGGVGAATWQSTEHPTVVVKKVHAVAAVEAGTGATTITSEQAFDIASRAVDVYREQARDNEARLVVSYGTALSPRLEIAADRTWRVHLGVELRRQGLTPPDVAAFVACHEIGHALGGFPFKHSGQQVQQVQGLKMGQFGTVSSAEGQADYFASKECLPRLWSAEREVNARFRETVTEHVKTRCDEAWGDIDAQNLCYRLAAVAEAFGRWTERIPVPDLSTPDTSEGTVTNYNNPPPQCRVDTVFQGALCQTKFRGTAIPGLIPPYEQALTFSPEVEAAAAPDSCTEGLGARPRCWFAPNVAAPDCTGIPELGTCEEVDGQTAVVLCDSMNGLQKFPCLPTGPCRIDEEGWALCGN
ncbi:trypsin-like peptidase domain-containing protein [Sorangium sp. So ce136]|uniref:trypsin-like peptidase domain-containing protein n=1 Tax=Sorangium sp. So ce136 TaxID=3133284 RepID=UPI003F0915E6